MATIKGVTPTPITWLQKDGKETLKEILGQHGVDSGSHAVVKKGEGPDAVDTPIESKDWNKVTVDDQTEYYVHKREING